MRGNNPPQGRRTSSKIFSRRNLLASSIGAGSLLLAGCLGDDADDDGADEGDDHADDGDDGEEAPGGDVLMLTTPEGTAGHAMGNGMMSLLTQETNYRGSAQSGTGTQANISQIMTGGADIASGTTPVVHDAYARNPPYDEVDAEHDPLQLWSFYVVLISTMAREGEGYEYVSDLSGDPIAVGPRETSFYPILSEFYQEAIDDYQPVYQAPPDISAELAAGNVSGAICLIAGGQVVSWAHEVVVENDAVLLGLADESVAAIEENPDATGAMYPNDIWGDDITFVEDEETFICSVNYIAIGSSGTDPDTIYDVMETMFDEEHRERLTDVHASFDFWLEDENWIELCDPRIPFHPGAAEFLQDQDLWDDEFEVADI